MDLRVIIDRVVAASAAHLPASTPQVRAALDNLADHALNPLRAWLTDMDMAVTTAYDAAVNLDNSDPCGRQQAGVDFLEALQVLGCELTHLVADALPAAQFAATRESCHRPEESSPPPHPP